MSFAVKLPVFAGPMDLLLHLVKQHEVDIHQVVISSILDEYLTHLRVLRSLDLGDIGDFVVMASTLMEIKSRELLPREEVAVEDELDPRDDLIRRLLQYKRYRDLSRRLARMSQRRSRMVDVAVPAPALAREPEEEALDLGDVEIWTLTEAFAKLLEATGRDQTMHIDFDRRDVRYYSARLLERLKGEGQVPFEKLFERSEGRVGLIGVFVAILEMVKQGYLAARQEQCLGPITVEFVGPVDLTAEEITRRSADLEPELAAEAEGEEGAAAAGAAPVAGDG